MTRFIMPAITKLTAKRNRAVHAMLAFVKAGYSPFMYACCKNSNINAAKPKANAHKKKSSAFIFVHFVVSHALTFMFWLLASIRKFYGGNKNKTT